MLQYSRTVNSGYNELRIILNFFGGLIKTQPLFVYYNLLRLMRTPRLYRTDFAGPFGVRYNRSRL